MIAVTAVFVAMIAYPPFHVVGINGVVFNMGYGWIFDPPQRGYMTATVNISMLLTQWIGVLVVGVIAFFVLRDQGGNKNQDDMRSVDNNQPNAAPKDESFQPDIETITWNDLVGENIPSEDTDDCTYKDCLSIAWAFFWRMSIVFFISLFFSKVVESSGAALALGTLFYFWILYFIHKQVLTNLKRDWVVIASKSGSVIAYEPSTIWIFIWSTTWRIFLVSLPVALIIEITKIKPLNLEQAGAWELLGYIAGFFLSPLAYMWLFKKPLGNTHFQPMFKIK